MTKLTLADLDTRQTPQKLLLALKRIQELEHALEQAQNSSVLEELRQHLADMEEEVTALRQQHLILKKRCEVEHELNAQHLKQIETLHTELQEREDQLALMALQPAIPVADENVPKLQAENAHLKSTLEEAQLHSRQLERVIHFLRERAEESFREAKQLREEFETRKDELHSSSQDQQEIHQQLAILSEQLEAERTTNNELLQKIGELQQQQQQQTRSHDSAFEEHEASAKIAQQHIAKKMKEIAGLLEQIDTQKFQLMDLRHALNDAQQQNVMVKQNLEMQLQQERHLHEQLEQRVLIAENQSKKWEEQYNSLYNSWQEGDAEKRSLKGIEERYRQLQGLFMNAQSLLDLSSASSTPLAPASSPTSVTTKIPVQNRYRSTTLE